MKEKDIEKRQMAHRCESPFVRCFSGTMATQNDTSQAHLHEILVSFPSGCGGSWEDCPTKRAIP